MKIQRHQGAPLSVRRRGLAAVAAVLLAAVNFGAFRTSAWAVAPACDGSNGVTVRSLNAPRFYIDSGISPALVGGYAGYDVASSTSRADLWVGLSNFSGGALTLAPSQPASVPLGQIGAASTIPAFFMLSASAASAATQNHTVTVYAGRPGSAGTSVVCSMAGGFSGVDETIKASANKVQDVTGDSIAVSLSTSTPTLGGTVSVTVEGSTGTIGAGTAADPNGLYMTPSALSSWPAGAFRLTSTSLRISPDGSAPAQTYTNLLHLAALGSSSRNYTATYTFTITGTTSTGSVLYPIQQIASGTQIKHTDTSSFATSIPPIPPVSNPLTVTLGANPTSLSSAGGTSHVTETLSSTSASTSYADELRATLPTGASYVSGTATLNGVAVADPTFSGGILSFPGPFQTSLGHPAVVNFDVILPSGEASYSITGNGLLAATVIDTTPDTTDSAPSSVVLSVPAPPSTGPTSEPSSSTPAPSTPAPSTPAPSTSASSEPAPSTSASSEPAPSTSATSEPAPSSSVPTSEPTSSEPPTSIPASSEPAPSTSATSEPAPSSSVPTSEPAPSSSVPTSVPSSSTPAPSTPAPSTPAPSTPAPSSSTPAPQPSSSEPQSSPPTAPAKRTAGVGTALQMARISVPIGGTASLLDHGIPTNLVEQYGQGTYRLDPVLGVISFKPVVGFVGAARAATYRVTGPDGQSAEATYTPTVTSPPPPVAGPYTTSGSPNESQGVAVPVPSGGSVTLLKGGRAVTTFVVPGQGTYDLNAQTGVITFTPVAGFVGTAAPVVYTMTDAYGHSIQATYTAHVDAPVLATRVAQARSLAVTGTDDDVLAWIAELLMLSGGSLCVLAAIARRRREGERR